MKEISNLLSLLLKVVGERKKNGRKTRKTRSRIDGNN